ncbi:Gfo/Idh/MocA family protein [Arthrobacter silvisoli]|uniref:Gfo/Idh/MocA family protein n=1 Tax=Arthrobacter silvisoli TaxID=2291022 RepID=UPI001FE7E05C|nr:Gfo/Idh/MocA family oxidoreductase [Arthrobacter silvisoli]
MPGLSAVRSGASHDSTHAALVTACLAAGKPVLCEKPLAPSVNECRDLVELEGDRGPVSLGFMRRFDPGHVELKRFPAQVRRRLVARAGRPAGCGDAERGGLR